MTKLGKFQASWEKKGTGYVAKWNTPKGTRGEIILPVVTKGVLPRGVIDGKRVVPKWNMQVMNGVGTVTLRVKGGESKIMVK